MSDQFDESNTKNWQQSGNGVFLLREIPGRWVGTGPDRRPATENLFAINVHQADRDRALEIGMARRVADFLNAQTDGPRQIRLTLAKDTTATECGSCQAAIRSLGMCGAFDRVLPAPPHAKLPYQRLPECIAAEVRL